MLATKTILFFSFSYIALLFAIAYIGDKKADAGASIISNPYIYALSLAVYCTAWTFYGSVGRAVASGPNFLTIYLGPTLMIGLSWFVLRKIIRISKTYRITSIADFIASRYGKSTTLGGLVAVIAVIGIVPYISIQLKAISKGFLILTNQSAVPEKITAFSDTDFYVALLLALFSIFFGTRHLDVTERHEGLVAAIAFESVVKLAAFLAVGLFVTFGLYNGFGDLMRQAGSLTDLQDIFNISMEPGTYANWGFQIFVSMMAILFLPRQFQVAVVENVNEEHLNKAMWLFPLYLIVINLFVLPVALGGLLHFPEGTVDPDTYVLALPMSQGQPVLTLLVFIGGMSAATGMVIVETVALSTMICNQLVMPVLLRFEPLKLTQRDDLSSLILTIRRISIILLLLLGYIYFRLTGEYHPLVSIGLVSFVAVTQFAPSVLGGIFWKGATRSGAMWGLTAGFGIWTYTLFLPFFVQGGIIPESFITEGPWGIEWLRPYQLFGLEGLSEKSHSVFWSMLFNIGLYVGISVFNQPSALEHAQAARFVDIFKRSEDRDPALMWRGKASLPGLRSVLTRFLGEGKTRRALEAYDRQKKIDWENDIIEDAGLIAHFESLLAGAIGSASARVMIATAVKEEPPGIDEVMDMLDETRHAIEYSHELEKATAELKRVNERLTELDRLKDDFIATVTHELKTPLTSVRSLTEILHENPELPLDQRNKFLSIIVKENERLSRLITQVLDFQKIEAGVAEWQLKRIDIHDIIEDALAASAQLIHEKQIHLDKNLTQSTPVIMGDRDRLIQVMTNLISNAIKFCDPENGHIHVRTAQEKEFIRIDIADNGVGIHKKDQEIIFEKFRQANAISKGRPSGTGLGLTITKQIIEFHAGRIWVESEPGNGTVFSFTLPISQGHEGEA
jgi:Na+/proline symporter/nitrogen-specific signal transduction histidine kinase